MRLRRVLFLFLLPFTVAVRAAAHPIDEQKVMTASRFTVGGKAVDFRIKFPAENFVRVAPGPSGDSSRALRELSTEEGRRRAAAYVLAHLLAFDGKENLRGVVTKVEVESNALSVDTVPRELVASGRFEGKTRIRDLYLFNEFFKEGPLPHFGDAVVEIGADLYDFQFRDSVYFHLDLTAPRPSASRR